MPFDGLIFGIMYKINYACQAACWDSINSSLLFRLALVQKVDFLHSVATPPQRGLFSINASANTVAVFKVQ